MLNTHHTNACWKAENYRLTISYLFCETPSLSPDSKAIKMVRCLSWRFEFNERDTGEAPGLDSTKLGSNPLWHQQGSQLWLCITEQLYLSLPLQVLFWDGNATIESKVLDEQRVIRKLLNTPTPCFSGKYKWPSLRTGAEDGLRVRGANTSWLSGSLLRHNNAKSCAGGGVGDWILKGLTIHSIWIQIT